MKTGTLTPSFTHTRIVLLSRCSMLTTKEFNFHSCHRTATGIQLKRHLRFSLFILFSYHCRKTIHLFPFYLFFIFYVLWRINGRKNFRRRQKNFFFIRYKQHSTSTYLLLSHAIEMRTERRKGKCHPKNFSCILDFRWHCWGKWRMLFVALSYFSCHSHQLK